MRKSARQVDHQGRAHEARLRACRGFSALRPGISPHPEETAEGGRLEGRGLGPRDAAGPRIPPPRNLLLTGINRTLTIHRAKIAGLEVSVAIECS